MIKHLRIYILLLTLIFFVINVKAQEDSTLIHFFKHRFEKIDKSKIQTNFLYDYTLPFVKDNDFDGINDSILTPNIWFNLNTFLDFATIKKSTINLPTNEVKETLNHFLQKNDYTIPIGVLNLDVDRIKPWAVDSNLLDTLNGQFFDVKNAKQSPYYLEHYFAATPLYNVNYTGKVTFCFDQSFSFCSINNKVLYFEADFDDGSGFNSYNMLSKVIINYSSIGDKKIKIIAHTLNGTYTSTSLFKVFSVLGNKKGDFIEPDLVLDLTSTIPFTPECSPNELATIIWTIS